MPRDTLSDSPARDEIRGKSRNPESHPGFVFHKIESSALICCRAHRALASLLQRFTIADLGKADSLGRMGKPTAGAPREAVRQDAWQHDWIWPKQAKGWGALTLRVAVIAG